MFAGSLTRTPITAVFCLMLTLLLAGCSGSKSSDMGSYSGAVYTVKRGDTLYRISRATGTSVKELATAATEVAANAIRTPTNGAENRVALKTTGINLCC